MNENIREPEGAVPHNAVLSLLASHVSIRKFRKDPVSGEQLAAIIGAGQMASTSSNVQAYSVIAVTEPELKLELAALSGNQAYVAECPVFLVWCADLYRLRKAAEPHLNDAETYEDSTENFIIATVDAALAAQNAAVAAESLGLGIVYIGGIRNNAAEAAERLGLPELVYPLFGMCLGYPDQSPVQRPRLPLPAVLHHNRYDAEETMRQVQAYDGVMSDYLRKRTGGVKDTPWSGIMAGRLAEPIRLHMKDFLQGKGFMRR